MKEKVVARLKLIKKQIKLLKTAQTAECSQSVVQKWLGVDESSWVRKMVMTEGDGVRYAQEALSLFSSKS